MEENGTKSNLNLGAPKYGTKQLVSPEQENNIRKRKISFSFSYFKQIDDFGIGNCSQSWHIGLLERLSSLGNMTLQEILEENRGSRALHCHHIDWDLKNIPVNRTDLNWLPKEVLDNKDEFPMLQFSISTSTGRFVGFFDRDYVFNIVLLDPNHNIQPSKKTGYQIQPTTNGISQYDELLNKLENIKKVIKDCKTGTCKLHSRLDEIEGLHDNIIYTGIDHQYYKKYHELLSKYSIQDIFEMGILSME